MNCSTCNLPGKLKAASAPLDGGLRAERRYVCANGHKFLTSEVHQTVYTSAVKRQRAYLKTVAGRAALYRRRAEAHRLKAAGHTGLEIAAALGLSPQLISNDLQRKP